MNTTVIIADDHALVREGIKAVLKKTAVGIDVIAEASNGKEVLEIAKKTPADVYLLDISMPLLNGIEVTSHLMRMNAKSRVIILSMHDDRISVERALKNGAKGFLIKETAPEEVVRAIQEVIKGNPFLSPKISRYILQDFNSRREPNEGKDQTRQLTAKEKEVIQLVAEGFQSKDIAKQLKIALSTVQVHRKNIMRKLNIHNQSELIRFAFKEGFCSI